jgi:hypothetical protein
MEKLIYTPLSGRNSLRILQLEPKSKTQDGNLRGQLFEISLDHPPQYEAISYVWGNSTTGGRILCDIPSGGEMKEVIITENGENILRQLQYPTKSRALWIDAVCINQDDLEERKQQVQLMDRVYHQASAVLIWLGDQNRETVQTAFKTVEALRDKIALLDSKIAIVTAKYPSGLQSLAPVTLEKELKHVGALDISFALEETEIMCLESVFKNAAWWSRVWCVQEITHSRNAIFVTHEKELSWTQLSPILKFIRGMYKDPNPSIKSLNAIFSPSTMISYMQLHLDQNLSSGGKLLDLLYSISERKCTDPRDRIYAITSLSRSAAGSILPDYTTSLLTLSLDTTKFIIEETKSLDILCMYNYISSLGRQFATISQAHAISKKVVDLAKMDADGVNRFFDNGGKFDGYDEGSTSQDMIRFTETYAFDQRFRKDRSGASSIKDPSTKQSIFCSDDVPIPSWVPNLTFPPYQFAPAMFSSHAPLYHASKGSSYVEKSIYHGLSWLLDIKGAVLDRIRRIAPHSCASRNLLPHNLLPNVLKEFSSLCSDMVGTRYKFTGEDFLQAYWRTLSMDRDIENSAVRCKDIEKTGKVYEKYFAAQESTIRQWLAKTLGSSVVDVWSPTSVSVHALLCASLHGYKFCVTEEGYIGLAGELSREGDYICIIDGASAPLVLRPHDKFDESANNRMAKAQKKLSADDKNFFTFVSPAYVHGAMDGEAMILAQEGRIQKQPILLI